MRLLYKENRIKKIEYRYFNLFEETEYIVQKKIFGLFWVNIKSFQTLRDAANYLKNNQ